MKVSPKFKQFDPQHVLQQLPSKKPARNKVTSKHATALDTDILRKYTFSN